MTTLPHRRLLRMLDAEGRLGADVPCARCAYNLRTRRPADVCPECGQGVESSLETQAWRYVRWIRRLNHGATLTLLSVLPCLVGLGGWTFAVNLTTVLVDTRAALRAAAALAYMVAASLAVLWVTAPEPHLEGPGEPRCTARRVTRWALGVIWALHLVGFLQRQPTLLAWWPVLARPYAVHLALPVTEFAAFFLLLHLGDLMTRAGRRGTARAVRVCAFAGAPLTIMILLSGGLGWAQSSTLAGALVLSLFLLLVGVILLTLLFVKAELAVLAQQYHRYAAR